MASGFVTWLQNIPTELKKFFTNPVIQSTIQTGLGIVSIVDPALGPLVSGVSAAIAKAEALAAAAGVQSASGAQKFSLALADAQASFAAYEQATGVHIESTQQTAIINGIVALLNNIPAATTQLVQASAAQVLQNVVAAVPTTAGHPVPVVEPLPVSAQVFSNTLL